LERNNIQEHLFVTLVCDERINAVALHEIDCISKESVTLPCSGCFFLGSWLHFS